MIGSPNPCFIPLLPDPISTTPRRPLGAHPIGPAAHVQIHAHRPRHTYPSVLFPSLDCTCRPFSLHAGSASGTAAMHMVLQFEMRAAAVLSCCLPHIILYRGMALEPGGRRCPCCCGRAPAGAGECVNACRMAERMLARWASGACCSEMDLACRSWYR